MTFGGTISDARKAAGLSQKDLAAKLRKEDGTSISPQYLNDIEHDRRNPPSPSVLDQLAEILELPPEYVYLKAGEWPADLRESQSKPEEIAAAFRAFRQRLER